MTEQTKCPGCGRLAGLLDVNRETIRPTVKAMQDSGDLKEVPAEYLNKGKLCWNSGIALPETVDAIIKLATSRGWPNPTGATGATGAILAPLTPVSAEGEPPACASPYTGDARTPVVDPHPEAVEDGYENLHPLRRSYEVEATA